MLPADELFADGKLLPLRKAAAATLPELDAAAPRPPQPEAMPAPSEPMKPLRLPPRLMPQTRTFSPRRRPAVRAGGGSCSG
ncbi:hypothetical protein E2562_016522 [Oryza meyeriana var. granulata]|uniref:Uncharacterized protein n=1 Tax=Oryza meyeriana var. granulata TaxID=110450 RepID=A0A6G1C6B0_9ORYZ|nr:hypothetical protein E2562_016522 [Oryza meyeriana var. granulata]